MSQLSFRERHTLLFRLWHWANFGVLTGLLLTVLLRKTLLSYRANAVILKDKLAEIGVTVTIDQAKDIAKVLRDNLWAWHVNLGLILAGLVVLRVVAEIFMRSEGRLVSKLSNGIAAWRARRDRPDAEAGHYSVVKLGYVVFYVCLVMMVGSGLTLTYGEGLGFPESRLELVAEVHETMMYFFLAFIVVHLVGVVRMELTKAPGLVSDMIHGGPKD